MSAGTISLTNNSDVIIGSGTNFTQDVQVGDFIVFNVGGIPYTLSVKVLNSYNSVSFSSIYTGPTASGVAYYIVPVSAMSLVSAALVLQSVEALRGLNADKANWQQVLTGTGNVTVTLPDGSTYTGPAWGGITTQLSSITTQLSGKAAAGANSDITSLTGLTSAVSITQGGTGAADAATARANLGIPTISAAQICTAWCTFNTDGSIVGSYNVSSVAKTATGSYTVYFAQPFSTANYSATTGAMGTVPTSTNGVDSCVTSSGTQSVDLMFYDVSGTTLGDPVQGTIQIFGGL